MFFIKIYHIFPYYTNPAGEKQVISPKKFLREHFCNVNADIIFLYSRFKDICIGRKTSLKVKYEQIQMTEKEGEHDETDIVLW